RVALGPGLLVEGEEELAVLAAELVARVARDQAGEGAAARARQAPKIVGGGRAGEVAAEGDDDACEVVLDGEDVDEAAGDAQAAPGRGLGRGAVDGAVRALAVATPAIARGAVAVEVSGAADGHHQAGSAVVVEG